jgi:glycosyltransferase involved in cell wall biosynthesis
MEAAPRILLVSTNDSGGAGLACLRLLRALRKYGAEVRMLVLDKNSDDEEVLPWFDFARGMHRKFLKAVHFMHRIRARQINDRLVRGRTFEGDSFTIPWPSLPLAGHPLVRWADVIHLHWCPQFWNWNVFKSLSSKAVLWTLHDLNPATGGCHYSGECLQYREYCHACPQLAGTKRARIVSSTFRFKKKVLEGSVTRRMTVVSPSRWMSGKARESALLGKHRHVAIENAFDEKVFRPMEKAFCRDVLGMPRGKKIVLFAANYVGNHRKGMDILLDAARELAGKGETLFYAAGFGVRGAGNPSIVPLGNIADERMMAIAYNACDVFAIPSREDNLPNTIAEAHLCGTPAAGFKVGGIPEMIHDGLNGVIADTLDAPSFAVALRRALANTWDRKSIADAAVRRYGYAEVARQHAELYARLVEESRRPE